MKRHIEEINRANELPTDLDALFDFFLFATHVILKVE
jgi:hypothetical protein